MAVRGVYTKEEEKMLADTMPGETAPRQLKVMSRLSYINQRKKPISSRNGRQP